MIRRAFLIVVLGQLSSGAGAVPFALSDRGALPILLAYADARADRAAENASGIDKLAQRRRRGKGSSDAEGRLFDPARVDDRENEALRLGRLGSTLGPGGGDREHLDEAFPEPADAFSGGNSGFAHRLFSPRSADQDTLAQFDAALASFPEKR